MKKTIWYLILAVFLAFNVSGCSLFGSSDDEAESGAVAEKSESGDEDPAEDDFEDGEEAETAEGGEDEGDDFAEGGDDFAEEGDGVEVDAEDSFAGGEDDSDEYPDDDYADTASGGGDEGSGDISDDDFADSDSVFVDEGQAGGQDLPDEPIAGNEEKDLFAQEDGSGGGDTFNDDFASAGGGGGYVAPAVGGTVSVKKMKPAAFRRAGANVNRLYVVRDGDDMTSVAQKIYGSDQSEKLYSYNGHFRNRSLKVGDKVYYSSPNNPDDSNMMTYYEDVGMTPSYYTSKKGENIRAIATSLLGHERSWMEVYATNENVDSKWGLPAGTQLRYWNGSGAPAVAPTMAQAEPAPVEAVEADVDGVEDVEEVAEVSPDDELDEVAEIDDTEDFDEVEDQEFTPPPATAGVTPPPPPNNKAGVPPPPPAPMPKKASSPSSLNAKDDSRIMGALGGLFILAAIAMFIFIRRSRAKRVNFSQTQV